jgi:glutathione S-transferase
MLRVHELVHSPYCIPVRRILEAYRIPFETTEVPNWDRRALAELTQGAYYQVPVIEHEGTIIHETPSDSLAVPHYLDRAFAGGALFPDHCAGIQEMIIEHIENDLEGIGFKLCDPGYVDAIADVGERAMLVRHKERKFGTGCVEQWRADAGQLMAALETALGPFEARLAHSAYLFGDQPVYADYALWGVMGNFQHGGEHCLDGRWANLHRWQRALGVFRA